MKNPNSQAQDENDLQSSFIDDIKTGLAFFSRLPIRKNNSQRALARAVRGFGVVGMILGGMVGVVFWLAIVFNLPPLLGAALALAFGAMLTGGLHEDGLADVADGFGGGWDVERKLEIMRDSAIGTYGVLAVVFAVILKIGGYSEVFSHGGGLFGIVFLFAGIGALSRIPMVLIMYSLELVRSDGPAHAAGKPTHDDVRKGLIISGIIGGVLMFISVGVSGFAAAFIATGLAYFVMSITARRQIGGYSGDVLGASQQLAEVFILLALVMIN